MLDAARLRARLDGDLVLAGEAGYERMRAAMIWNDRQPEARPLAIVRVASVDDVVTAISAAREAGVQVVARSGGHHWSGIVLRQGSLLLDLGRLNEVEVDATGATAKVGPGVRNGELCARLTVAGRAFPYGHCSNVALGGYLLGGGFGWNSGGWGPACFSVEAADVVTAAGELIHVDADHHPDYFWALRGAGPQFFGIVVRYSLRLQRLPRSICTASFGYPLPAAGEIAEWVADIGVRLPRSVELTLLLASAPPDAREQFASEDGKACLLRANSFADRFADAREPLTALEHGPVGARHREPYEETPFEVLFERMDAHFPAQQRCVADTIWSNADARELIDSAVPHLRAAPSARNSILAVLTPAPSPNAPVVPDTAFSMVGRAFVACYGMHEDPALDARQSTWLTALMDELEPRAVGHYVGESDLTRPQRLERSFSAAAWNRLQQLRRRHDPSALFG